MFIDHFKMTLQPFVERLPVDQIWQDQRMTEGLSRLQYLLHSGTIALLTGQTGVGKSSLLKIFLHSVSANNFYPVYLHITHIKPTSLLKLIVSSMGEIPKSTKERLFSQILEKATQMEATPVILCDEAHLLPSEALVDLRLLVSCALDETAPLKIILSGQDPLRQQLKRSCHLDLSQRITVRYHLPTLTKDQTAAYLDYHMKNAGSNDKVFEPEVKNLIHEHSCGVPRQINNIATACLLQAAANAVHKITLDIFTTAIRECQN